MSQYCLEKVLVDTPFGKRYHGEIWVSKTGKLVFMRQVDPERDKMKIFDAYSIHPSVLQKLKTKNIVGISYFEKGSNRLLKLSTNDLLKMLSGEIKDAFGRIMAWKDEFKGGETIYIKMIAFNEAYKGRSQ